MRFVCRCGNMLTNQLDPNDTESVSYTHLTLPTKA